MVSVSVSAPVRKVKGERKQVKRRSSRINAVPFVNSCEICSEKFTTFRKKTKTCSTVCLRKLQVKNNEANLEIRIEAGKKTIERIMREGKWKGWSGKGEPSYPEKFIAGLLDKASVEYVREHPVSRFSLDFAFMARKVALEVDGKQHEYPDRKAHDVARDDLLGTMGWKVFRLKWKPVNKQEGLDKVLEQFSDFMKVLE